MSKIIRPIAIFGLLYLGASFALSRALPPLMAWHFTHCSEPSRACSASATILQYWWLALLPVLGVATLVINWALVRRHAA
jgi:hypothetical protein